MTAHTQREWEEIERLTAERVRQEAERAAWSYKLAAKARQSIRNAFDKFRYVKARYRDNIEVFKNVVLNMSGTKILASLREFRNIVKLLVQDARAWTLIPSGERDLIVKAAKLAGVMVMVPAYVALSQIS